MINESTPAVPSAIMVTIGGLRGEGVRTPLEFILRGRYRGPFSTGIPLKKRKSGIGSHIRSLGGGGVVVPKEKICFKAEKKVLLGKAFWGAGDKLLWEGVLFSTLKFLV